ncbi:Endogenous retrovirus group K member 19 Pol protein [Dictyocoela muelleri]|nr:Endogenous retrovirus group K member 19 Pol protein [Dictyocoela muelleri]
MTGSLKIKHNYHYILFRKPHERLFLDIVDLSQYKELNNEYRYILTCLDSFSKFAFCFQLYRKDAGLFLKLDELCAIEGRWVIIHTDNGKEFCNKELKRIIDKYNNKHVKGRPRYPQSQGQIELFNRTLKNRLSKTLFGKEKK